MSGSHGGLADKVLITQEIPAQSATTVKNGAGVDMQGWDGVAFVIDLGTFTGAAVFDAYAEQDDNSGFNSATKVAQGDTNAELTQVAAASDNNVAIIDVFRPTERYVRCVATPAVAAVVFGVTAVRYRRGAVLPPTQAAIQVVALEP